MSLVPSRLGAGSFDRLATNARPGRPWARPSPPAGLRHRQASFRPAGWKSNRRRPAQRPKASSSRSLTRVERTLSNFHCSTPEGVIVAITGNAGDNARPIELLNARRRHRRRSPGSTRPGDLPTSPLPAQRPKASSSSITRRVSFLEIPRDTTAQRPKASSSRSRPNGPVCHRDDRTAQRPKASSSSALGLLQRETYRQFICSTPEGVIVVGITRFAARDGGRRDRLLNARRRHRRRHQRE